MTYPKYEEIFKKFKDITKEESKISSIIKENIKISPETKLLDIGASGVEISHKIHNNPKNITLLDIDEIETDSGAKFIKESWEEVNLDEKFDIILSSHVWGHFYKNSTEKFSFNKMVSHLKENGKLILCYNINKGFMEKLIKFSKNILPEAVIDQFDEDLINNMKKQEINFEVPVKGGNFGDLARLFQVLILVSDEEYKKVENRVKEFLMENLEEPKFTLKQKVVILSKN